ncbi:MAG TPA: fimbria/pilus outer membrane usher protein, partial [Methylomirabilota bacterium]|nr:fimbria/pilus outer membrane usher protein [Methylomirabilota bacterium]
MQYRDEIQVVIPANRENLKVQAAPLLREIEFLARAELLRQIASAVDAQGNLRLQELQELGLDAVFDEEKLELRVAVPAGLRRASDTQFTGRSPPRGAESALRPSDFSAFVNLRTGLDYVGQSATGLNEGLQPFRSDLDGALNLRDWVLEGGASYTEDAATPWRRNDARVVYDDPSRMIRYSVGDLSYPTTGFQSFQPLLGLTVARNFSLQPYRVTEPLGQTSFFLKNPARVDVLVNGQRVQTLQLPAGPHNLRNFLFASGANDVTLRITDDVGLTETIHLSFFFDYQLLAQGEHEFGYSIGLPSREGESDRHYDARFPGFSALHRVGLTDRLTAGLNLQGDGDQQMLGADTVWATRIGTFQPDLGLSRVEGVGWDYAARLGYRYYDAARTWAGTFALAAQYRGPLFASLGNLEPDNSVAWDFSARYSRRLPRQMNVGIGGTYQILRSSQRDSSGVNLFLGKRFGRGAILDVTLDRRELSTGETEYRAYASLTLSFPNRRQTARFSHDSFTETSRADWQYNALHSVGGVDANLGAQRRPDDYNAYGGLRYNGYRAEAGLTHDVTTPDSSSENLDSRTSIRLGTAVVYADGQFAVSRPVRDSFAIVVPHPDFAGQTIGVDPVRDSYAARADRFGPAVLPDLRSYLVRNVTIDAPDLPPGYDLGPGVHTIRPTYKSGTVIRVGTGATVLLIGVLETANGVPVTLQAGEIVSLKDPQRAPVQLFTNRDGRFSVEGLKPGEHELRLYADPQPKARFEIPEGKAGIYDIGT